MFMILTHYETTNNYARKLLDGKEDVNSFGDEFTRKIKTEHFALDKLTPVSTLEGEPGAFLTHATTSDAGGRDHQLCRSAYVGGILKTL